MTCYKDSRISLGSLMWGKNPLEQVQNSDSSTWTLFGPIFFCFIVSISWPTIQICTVNSVFDCWFWGCCIIYLKCRCSTDNNAMKPMRYLLRSRSTKSQYINKIQKYINKKLTKVSSTSAKWTSEKINSH